VGGERESVQKAAMYVQVSRELLDDAAWFHRWAEASPEQRVRWQREAADRRTMERASAPLVRLDEFTLVARLGWSREYAHHFVQPYCSCEASPDDGWYVCPHADDLGLAP
jgi:hypothetical protein